MAYQNWSVVAGEQPTTAKWNILGTNDASFNDGSGFAAGAIPTAALANGAATPAKSSNNYAFSAYRSGSAVSVGATTFSKVQFNSEAFDYNGNFDSTTNFRYVAPVTGTYHFSFAVNGANNIGAQTRYISSLYKNGVVEKRTNDVTMPATHFAGWHGSCEVELAATDYAEVYVWSGNATDYNNGAEMSWFSGYLIRQA